MNIEFDKEELDISLKFAKIKNWLEDDLHKRLFHALTMEGYLMDKENSAKRMLSIASENINPTAFILTLQKMRSSGDDGKSFCGYLLESILSLCTMTEKLSREEIIEFVEEKEKILGATKTVLNLDFDLDGIKKFLGKENNVKYILKVLKEHEEYIKGDPGIRGTDTEYASSLVYSSFEKAMKDGTLIKNIEYGYKSNEGLWGMIVEMVKALIQLRGGRDVDDSEL